MEIIIPKKGTVRSVSPWGLVLVIVFLILDNSLPGFARPLNDPSYPSPLRQGIQEAGRQILSDHPRKALSVLAPLTRTYPDYSIVFTLAGMAYGKSGQNDKAIAMERRALILDPKNLTALTSLGIALGNTGHFRQEVREEAVVLHRDPKREAAWRALGWAYGSLGQWKEARNAEKRAIGLRPSDAEARMILGLALAHEGYLQEALLMEESAQKLDPQDEGIHRSLTFIKHTMSPPLQKKPKSPGFNPLLAPTPGLPSESATPANSQQMSPPLIRAPSVIH